MFLGVQRSNFQLRLEFLQYALIVVFPELLGCVLARDSCEDLLSACPKSAGSPSNELGNAAHNQRVIAQMSLKRCSVLTWMLILELGQVVDIFVNYDPKVVWLIMRRYVTLREGLRHDEGEAMLAENSRGTRWSNEGKRGSRQWNVLMA